MRSTISENQMQGRARTPSALSHAYLGGGGRGWGGEMNLSKGGLRGL